MSRTFILGLLTVGFGGLLVPFVYYYRGLRQAYEGDRTARKSHSKSK